MSLSTADRLNVFEYTSVDFDISARWLCRAFNSPTFKNAAYPTKNRPYVGISCQLDGVFSNPYYRVNKFFRGEVIRVGRKKATLNILRIVPSPPPGRSTLLFGHFLLRAYSVFFSFKSLKLFCLYLHYPESKGRVAQSKIRH